jgi:hypothetical protein
VNRKDYIDKIAKYLARFVEEIKAYNDMSLYDYNIHAENALIPILDKVYDLNLENVNANNVRTFPAIDLSDQGNKVAFQITVTPTLEKIKSTLSSFSNHKLYEQYDTLYIFILTEKQSSYSSKSIDNLLPQNFEFEISRHIIDMSNLRQKIMDIPSLEKLSYIARLCEREFSDIQINERKKVFQNKYLKNEPEKVFLNFLNVEFPDNIFIADLSYNEEECKISINQRRKLKNKNELKSFKKGWIISEAFSLKEIYAKDYILRENQLITFKNLNSSKERLRSIVDIGTITEISAKDYYDTSESHLNNFKDLLKKSLIQLGHGRGLEWVNDRGFLRFKNNRDMPRELKKSWRKKNNAVKTVIFEIINKKEGHVICFRHMAFEPSFELIDDNWFLVVNPTWSFTNPGGYRTSKYEASYMAGLKRQERNNTVYYQYRFWGYFFLYPDMYAPVYPYLRISSFEPFDFSPSIDDAKWLPQKEFKPQNERESELNVDNELSLKFLEG